MRGMREDNLNFFVAVAGMGDKKLEPYSGEERHIAAEDEIPFGGGICGGGMLQSGDHAAEGPFAGPLIFDRFQISAKVAVLAVTSDDHNISGAGLREPDNIQQQWSRTKANESLVATKPRTCAASENVGAEI